MNNGAFPLEEALFTCTMADEEGAAIKFQHSMYMGLWEEAMKSLKTEELYQSKLHGRGHIERTMLFGALLAMEESLSREDTVLLLLGCSYHDVGRINDRQDDDHGRRSAEQIGRITGLPEGEDLNLLRVMAEAHSLDDEELDQLIIQQYVKP